MDIKTITPKAPSDGIASGQPQAEPTMDTRPESEPSEGAALSDATGQPKATDSRNFPSFDFFPYGYLY